MLDVISNIGRLLLPGRGAHLASRRHRVMFAVDIAGFSKRDYQLQLIVRAVLYQIFEDACAGVGLPWSTCYVEDRGDGFFLIAPETTDLEARLETLIARVEAALRDHNATAARPGTAFRLRMAFHAGYTQRDKYGVTGTPLIHLFRLLDSDAVRERVADTDLAVILSDQIHQSAMAERLLDPAAYHQITTAAKDSEFTAWLHLPPTP